MPPSGSTTHLKDSTFAAAFIGFDGLGVRPLSHAGWPSTLHCCEVATLVDCAHLLLSFTIQSDGHFQMRCTRLPTGACAVCYAVASTLCLTLFRFVTSS